MLYLKKTSVYNKKLMNRWQNNNINKDILKYAYKASTQIYIDQSPGIGKSRYRSDIPRF